MAHVVQAGGKDSGRIRFYKDKPLPQGDQVTIQQLKSEAIATKRERLLAMADTRNIQAFKANLANFIKDPTDPKAFDESDRPLKYVFKLIGTQFLARVQSAQKLEEADIKLFQNFIKAMLTDPPLGVPTICYLNDKGKPSSQLEVLRSVYQRLGETDNAYANKKTAAAQKSLFNYMIKNLNFQKSVGEARARKLDDAYYSSKDYATLQTNRTESYLKLLQTLYNFNKASEGTEKMQVLDFVAQNKITRAIKKEAQDWLEIIPAGVTIKDTKMELDPDSPFDRQLLDALTKQAPATFSTLTDEQPIKPQDLTPTKEQSLPKRLQAMAQEFTFVDKATKDNPIQEALVYKQAIIQQAVLLLEVINTKKDETVTEEQIETFIYSALEVEGAKTETPTKKHQEFISWLWMQYLVSLDEENSIKKAMRKLLPKQQAEGANVDTGTTITDANENVLDLF